MKQLPKISKIIMFMCMLSGSHAFADVYKWIDEEGVTHYEDCPPRDCVYEQLELPEGPSEEDIELAKEQVREILEARRAREASESAKRDSESLAEQQQAQLEVERLNRCAEAIYQLDLLDQNRRVFQIQADGSRLYLEDTQRPAEISRITALKNQYCSTRPIDQEKQLELAAALSIGLSRNCAAAREALHRMQQPGSNAIEEKLENYQAYVEAYCPAINSDHLWLGDWIIVRKTK